LILQITDDLIDGFLQGGPHLMEFYKFNIKRCIEASCDPQKAMLVSAMGTPSIS